MGTSTTAESRSEVRSHPLALDPLIESRNIDSLRRAAPQVAEALAAATLPADLRLVTARDGSPTFCWTNPDGGIEWHGRTQLPAIRAEALADVFQPGVGNVALAGVGHGRLARVLLDRMHAIQAVFVVEPDAASLALALRLHDFAADIESGRLCLFAGARAWDELTRFLLENEGYLVPDRVVSWPWFAPADIADVTNRLSRMSADITAHRRERIDVLRGRGDARSAVKLLIVAPEGAGCAAAVAAGLVGAAKQLGWNCRAAIADRPAGRHPAVFVRAMLETAAERLILVNVPRDRLPELAAENQPVLIWLTDAALVSEELIARLTPADRLIVPDSAAYEKARRLGCDASHVRRVPPGADPTISGPAMPPAVDVGATAVGLTQASHAALWKATAARIERGVGAWRGEQAEAFVRGGEADSGVRLTSEEVRQAILERVRGVLGPGVEANAYRRVWLNRLGEETPTTNGPVLRLPAGGRVDAALLSAAAQGRVLFVRAHPAQNKPDGWASFLDARNHVAAFASPRELDAALKAYRADSTPFSERARAAGAHVLACHTWMQRLQAALAD